MFHNIPPKILERMAFLEHKDAQDRQDGTPHLSRLRQIPPETGKFLALMAASAPEGAMLEIGTSGGYSSLWLILACRERGSKLVTFEIVTEKIMLARQTFSAAGVQDYVDIVEGDTRKFIPNYAQVAFCFLDTEKSLYQDCYDLVVPNLVSGGIIVADNVISHKEELSKFISNSEQDRRVDALIVPIGKGLLVCRKV
jgi:caffeoyl-CoA O-methyltransferase